MSDEFNLYAELQGQALWRVGPVVTKPASDCGGPCHCDHYHESDDPDEEFVEILLSAVSSGIEDDELPQPLDFGIAGVYPNPFNATTLIRFNLPDAGRVEVIIFDQLGRNIKVLLNCQLAAGRHAFSWDGTDGNGIPVNSGIYFCRVNAGDDNDVIKMVGIK